MKPIIPLFALTGSLLPAFSFADHPTLSLDDGSPGPLTTISAITMPKGSLSSAVQGQFIFNNEISDSDLREYSLLNEHVHSIKSVNSTSLNTAYGVSDDFTFGVSLPYLSRIGMRDAGHSHGAGEDHNRGTVVNQGDINGVGDATFYGQFQFFRDEVNDRHLALIGGLKTPNGRTDARAPGGKLFSPHHQPGSGSWDPLIGLALTQQSGAWSFDVNGLYTMVTDGTDGSNLGDVVNYNVAVSYRVLGSAGVTCAGGHDHHAHGDGDGDGDAKSVKSSLHHDYHGPTWDLIVEANGDWRDVTQENGFIEDNTGGNIIFLSAGSRLALASGWAGTLSIGLPVVEDLNGIQSEPNLRLLLGISKSF